jgi:drug/metabolite transporter (DMT)-like permease
LLSVWTFGLRRQRIPASLGPKAWLLVAGIGLINVSVVRFALLLSLDRLPVNTHTFLLGFVGLVTMVLSALILRESPSRGQVLGALVALLGIRVFFAELPPPQQVAGVGWVALAVIGLASTNNLARWLPRLTGGRLPNDVFSTLALWVGGAPLVAAGVAMDGWPAGLGLRNWAVIAVSGTMSIAIGLTLFNHVLRTLRSYEASVLSGSGLVFTALFAMPILGEYLGAREIAGIALLMGGMAWVQRPAPPSDAGSGRA